MKRQAQVITTYQGDEPYGGASCPFCGKRNVLTAAGDGKFKWLLIDTETRCPHADMAVDAGYPDVAIHFLSNRSFA